jgi:hypothetical protein
MWFELDSPVHLAEWQVDIQALQPDGGLQATKLEQRSKAAFRRGAGTSQSRSANRDSSAAVTVPLITPWKYVPPAIAVMQPRHPGRLFQSEVFVNGSG